MNLCIVGTGYVGLVSGACFAKLGNKVTCVDIDENKINMLKESIIPIYEPDLEKIVKEEQEKGLLNFTTDLTKAIKEAEIIFICVGTPSTSSGAADLSAFYKVAEIIAKEINGYKIIVDKSTVPVGTAEKLEKIIKNNLLKEYAFDVISVPEFLREGNALYDTLNPERIIIGAKNKLAATVIEELHKPLNAQVLHTDTATAEMIKYAANSFLALKISFINGIAGICDKFGADVTKVAEGIGMDSRIGSKFLQAGLGFGGACFPKDVKALLRISEEVGEKFNLLEEVLIINYNQRQKILNILSEKMGSLKGKRIAILGLSFKPNTDDLREAPALDIIKGILNLGGKVSCYDPVAVPGAKEILCNDEIVYANSALEACKGSDAVVLVTEWEEVKNIDIKEARQLMQGNVFIDGRNVFEPEFMRKHGFNYVGMGRN